MDLCDDLYKCLQLLKDDKVIKNKELIKLIKLVCKQLNYDSSLRIDYALLGIDDVSLGIDDKSLGIDDVSLGIADNSSLRIDDLDHNQKKLFITIYCLYLEVCRLNTNLNSELNELRAVLNRVDILDSNKRLIIETYATDQFRSSLKKKLSSLCLDCKQQFIDQFKTIDLTKDSVVKSSKKMDYRHICQTEYLMNIQTATIKHLFTCSIQDIESMSVKFKEIMKTLDNLFIVKNK